VGCRAIYWVVVLSTTLLRQLWGKRYRAMTRKAHIAVFEPKTKGEIFVYIKAISPRPRHKSNIPVS
jgi:hypothetical protein